jgi:hypothetical protein
MSSAEARLHELEGLDPLTHVEAGLDLLPPDTALNDEGWQVVQEIDSGLNRLQVEVGAQLAALDYRLKNGVRRVDVAGEQTMLEALVLREGMARERLRTFIAAAAEANGIQPPHAGQKGRRPGR